MRPQRHETPLFLTLDQPFMSRDTSVGLFYYGAGLARQPFAEKNKNTGVGFAVTTKNRMNQSNMDHKVYFTTQDSKVSVGGTMLPLYYTYNLTTRPSLLLDYPSKVKSQY